MRYTRKNLCKTISNCFHYFEVLFQFKICCQHFMNVEFLFAVYFLLQFIIHRLLFVCLLNLICNNKFKSDFRVLLFLFDSQCNGKLMGKKMLEQQGKSSIHRDLSNPTKQLQHQSSTYMCSICLCINRRTCNVLSLF